MRKNIQRKMRGFCCVALAVIMALTGVPVPGGIGKKDSAVAVAEAATTSNRIPMWAYMKSGSGKLTTYTSNALNKSSGYIVPGDYCKITAFYSNGSVKVTYPTSRGSKTAYAATSGFMASTNFSTQLGKIGKRLTAYRRSTGNATIGTVYAQDAVMIIGNANGRTQVQYPCSGGYKLGWVAGNYSIESPTANQPQGALDSATTAKINLNVPSYKQYDARWKNTKIGTKTIGSIGCLLTSLSMKYSYQTGTTVYPNSMKSKLRFSNNDLYWSSVSALGYNYTGNYGCSINNAMMSTIYSKLKSGKPVIIGGRKSNGSTHWVIIKGYQGSSSTSFSSSNFTINDPNSSSRTTLSQFLAAYPTVLRLVY